MLIAPEITATDIAIIGKLKWVMVIYSMTPILTG